MGLPALDNLVKTKQLKEEPFNILEFSGLTSSGEKRLKDANNLSLSLESRFDLAYNAAHSFALAALRWHGYRPADKQRYIVFQVLPHTIGAGQEVWRILDTCHKRRNVAEYEGYFEVEDQLFQALLSATQTLMNYISNNFK